NPNFVSTPQTSVGGVDYTGLVNNQYNQQVAQSNAMAGGLFGLLGSGLTAGIKYSDRRLKENIRRVGRLDNGLPVYAYNMVGSPVTEIGVMADEVETVNPGAVHVQPNGFKMVDYQRAPEAHNGSF
ncbi:MAG: tail fiber domain-containing protein, partial [Rhizobiaceae bacterium]|nr:tail fiber domain-containing protein [Rhizobiaceae bacterium]